MKKLILYYEFLDNLKKIYKESGVEIFYPYGKEDFHLSKLTQDENLKVSLSDIRTIEPIKSLFFLPQEEILTTKDATYRIIVGVKQCDLKALSVLDRIYINEYEDILYSKYRKKTLIISSDCPYPKPSCFCSLIGGKPYVSGEEQISDINISFIDDNNLILETFSTKGEEFLRKYFDEYDTPSKNDELKRDSIREISVKKIYEFNKEYFKEDSGGKYYKTLKNTYELDEVWKKESEKCVQCGGCNFICPSCYCFLIREASENYQRQYRDKVWDVCHFTGYARVAGGANPRKYKFQRFRNRYQCKFVYRYENFGFYACTGCGRCIDVCPAKIDIRKVIRSLILAKGEQVLVQN